MYDHKEGAVANKTTAPFVRLPFTKEKKICPTCQQEVRSKYVYIQRVVKILISIVLIKLVRLYLAKHSVEVGSYVEEIEKIMSLESVLRWFVCTGAVTILILLGAGFLLKGKKFLYTSFFAYFAFVLFDFGFMLVFPEITIAVLKAITHTN
ncbi:hypothetical protein D3C71_1172890 [compost metagenome]